MATKVFASRDHNDLIEVREALMTKAIGGAA